jgi:hypothetical protein
MHYPVGTDAKLLTVLRRVCGERFVRFVIRKTSMPTQKDFFSSLPSVQWKSLQGYQKGIVSAGWIGKMLTHLGWQGKEFQQKNNVQALILQRKTITLGKAKVIATKWDGKKTLAMQYKFLPIRDYFKQLDEHTIMGAMTVFWIKRPVFYFYLKKV